MKLPPIRLRKNARVASLTLCSPPVNAVDEAWLDAFDAAVADVARDGAIGVLRIASDQRAFCAGADLAYMRERFATGEGRARFIAFTRRMAASFDALETLGAVVVCEIGGAALGGGLELALCCDLRIAAHTARLGLPEARLGLLPAAGGTQRLTRLCGPGVARRLILGAEVVSGETAEALGVVQWCVEPAALAARTDEIVADLAMLSRDALAACKACIVQAARLGAAGFELEIESSARLLGLPDTQARVQAFLEGRRAAPSTRTNAA